MSTDLTNLCTSVVADRVSPMKTYPFKTACIEVKQIISRGKVQCKAPSGSATVQQGGAENLVARVDFLTSSFGDKFSTVPLVILPVESRNVTRKQQT